MRVLSTTPGTSYGNAFAELLAENHEVVCYGHEEHPELESVIGDRRDYDAVKQAVDGVDAIVDLPTPVGEEGDWDPHEEMIEGAYNLLRAAEEAKVSKYIIGSTNRTVEGYEIEHAPDLYELDYDFSIDHTVPPRPGKLYGVSRLFAENIARLWVESTDHKVGRMITEERPYPEQAYVIRWGSVRMDEGSDHPYSDAEFGVEDGLWERDSEQYNLAVKRMKATWISRRDLGQLLECIMEDDSVTFDVFYGVSNNDRRWFDLEHAKARIGYDPVDNGEDWTEPPE